MKKIYIAHITMEADTPLKVGSNASDFTQDSPIQKDWNGLPMILGTSIAGVLRKDFEGNKEEIFGGENGSKVIVSNALLVNEEGTVYEDLLLSKSDFLDIFNVLPLREHTAITDKGVAKEHSKFDEEVVFKGARFKFSIEMLEDEAAFEKMLQLLGSPSFRLGGGSTKGFGKCKVIHLEKMTIDTPEALAKSSSSLNVGQGETMSIPDVQSSTHTKYMLNIKPDDFFMFGSGFGDEDADQTPVYETVIDYKEKSLSKNYILIPGSSIKGTIAHRTTFHYNVSQALYVGNDDARTNIPELFGEAKESKEALGSKGKILFCDTFVPSKGNTKVFDHVSIDRFTGGAIESALFNEKTVADSRTYSIEMMLENSVDEVFVTAFEKTLDDVCNGMLSFGGASTKGHGVFTGEWSKV